MNATPDFLDHQRPAVPDLVVPRGVTGFYLRHRPVRGRLVRLGPLAQSLLDRHDHPDPIKALTAEALALAAVLASGLKFQGSFSVQAKGNGPVTLLVADCTDSGALRGYAKFDTQRLQALAHEPAPLSARVLLGQGYFAFTVDQGPDSERYQGLVGIEGDSLTAMAAHYFATSEQTPTFLRLAAAHTPQGWRAGGLVLQRLGEASDAGNAAASSAFDPDDAWHTATTLAATLTDAELLDDGLAPERLLYRLFHGEDVIAERPRALAYGCRCSRAHLSSILAGFADDDLADMAEDGRITMTCEFCNLDFIFDRAQLSRPA